MSKMEMQFQQGKHYTPKISHSSSLQVTPHCEAKCFQFGEVPWGSSSEGASQGDPPSDECVDQGSGPMHLTFGPKGERRTLSPPAEFLVCDTFSACGFGLTNPHTSSDNIYRI